MHVALFDARCRDNVLSNKALYMSVYRFKMRVVLSYVNVHSANGHDQLPQEEKGHLNDVPQVVKAQSG